MMIAPVIAAAPVDRRKTPPVKLLREMRDDQADESDRSGDGDAVRDPHRAGGDGHSRLGPMASGERAQNPEHDAAGRPRVLGHHGQKLVSAEKKLTALPAKMTRVLVRAPLAPAMSMTMARDPTAPTKAPRPIPNWRLAIAYEAPSTMTAAAPVETPGGRGCTGRRERSTALSGRQWKARPAPHAAPTRTRGSLVLQLMLYRRGSALAGAPSPQS